MTVRAVIFDLDGTIVDSHAYTFAAFRTACAPFRTPPADDEIYAAFGPSERVILETLLRPPEIDAAYARLQEAYGRDLGRLGMHPQMRPLLADLGRAGIACGLFTGRGADSTVRILEGLDLDAAFGAVLAGDAAVRPTSTRQLRPKPAGDGVTYLLEALGCGPAEALVVGDSQLDLDAARAAGVAAVLASWHPWSGRSVQPRSAVARVPDDLRARVGIVGPLG